MAIRQYFLGGLLANLFPLEPKIIPITTYSKAFYYLAWGVLNWLEKRIASLNILIEE